MLPRLALALTLLFSAYSVADAAAQSPAYVAVVDGAATVDHDGRVEDAPLNLPVVAGDRLRTANGRMEVRLPDGSVVDLDAGSAVDYLSDNLLRLLDGRVRVSVPRGGRTVALRVDSPAGSARVTESGEYRIAIVPGNRQGERQLELAVVMGDAEIFTEHGSTSLAAGERAYAVADLQPSDKYPFNSALSDDFARWPQSPETVDTAASQEYLPSDMQAYSPTFDAYGDWQYLQPYGYVWYPRVATGWRPYNNGHWMAYPRFGMTWIGADRFAWPTHHYGRWGMSNAGAWYWIPSSHWAPAYVSWAYTSDSVSWCPLGVDNRAVVSARASAPLRAVHDPVTRPSTPLAWSTTPAAPRAVAPPSPQPSASSVAVQRTRPTTLLEPPARARTLLTAPAQTAIPRTQPVRPEPLGMPAPRRFGADVPSHEASQTAPRTHVPVPVNQGEAGPRRSAPATAPAAPNPPRAPASMIRPVPTPAPPPSPRRGGG